jgi:hypothetical protein
MEWIDTDDVKEFYKFDLPTWFRCLLDFDHPGVALRELPATRSSFGQNMGKQSAARLYELFCQPNLSYFL